MRFLLLILLQALVLAGANAHASLRNSGNSAELIALLARCNALDAGDAQSLAQAHAELLDRAIRCTLDARPRIVLRDEGIERATAAVRSVAAHTGVAIDG